MVRELEITIVSSASGETHVVRILLEEGDTDTLHQILALCREFAVDGCLVTNISSPSGTPEAS